MSPNPDHLQPPRVRGRSEILWAPADVILDLKLDPSTFDLRPKVTGPSTGSKGSEPILRVVLPEGECAIGNPPGRDLVPKFRPAWLGVLPIPAAKQKVMGHPDLAKALGGVDRVDATVYLRGRHPPMAMRQAPRQRQKGGSRRGQTRAENTVPG